MRPWPVRPASPHRSCFIAESTETTKEAPAPTETAQHPQSPSVTAGRKMNGNSSHTTENNSFNQTQRGQQAANANASANQQRHDHNFRNNQNNNNQNNHTHFKTSTNNHELDAKEEIDNRNNNFRNNATHHHHDQHRRSRENDDIECDNDGDTANHNTNGKNNNERIPDSNSTNNNDEHHRNPTRQVQGRPTDGDGNGDRASLQQQQVPNDNHDGVDGAINNAHHDHHENRSVPTPKPQANEASTPLAYFSFRRRPPAAPAKKTKTYRQEMNSGRERKHRCPYDEDWLRGKPNIDSTSLLATTEKPNLPSHMDADSEVQQRKNEEQLLLQFYRNKRHATPAKVPAARTKMAELLTRTSSNLLSAQNRHQGGDSSGSLQQQQVPNDNNHDGVNDAQQHRSLSAGSATNRNKNNTSTSDEE